jgi:ribonuclease T
VEIPTEIVKRFAPSALLSKRFRGFLPVVIDVETGGFNAQTDALLEIAAVLLQINDDNKWVRGESIHRHVQPFPGANIEKAALEFTGIDPTHPFRNAVSERHALDDIFKPVRKLIVDTGCTRAILVGHNAFFDLGFVKAAVERCSIKRNPFHSFSTLDTAALSALVYGQTVLARAVEAAGMKWKANEAHSAIYDAEVTADLFCNIVNRWDALARNDDDASP